MIRKFTPAYFNQDARYAEYYASYCWWSFDDVIEFDHDRDSHLYDYDIAFDYVVCEFSSDIDSQVKKEHVATQI